MALILIMGKKIKSKMNEDFSKKTLWFITGSQNLYGDDVLMQVKAHTTEVAMSLNESQNMPIKILDKGIVTTSEEITALIKAANNDDHCVGIIAWMHTFSPAKMWINGLRILQKPLLHLHTQYNRDIPWSSIDMDFMNLNQSAHGGREFGYIMTRMNINRKVVVGHWKEPSVKNEIAQWARVALGWEHAQSLKVARLGDNMRDVAVTEGDKVAAHIQLGYAVNGYGLGDLSSIVTQVADKSIEELVAAYRNDYKIAKQKLENASFKSALHEAARIEIALRQFLDERGCQAFTDTFENLTGLSQLPGIAVQRMMNDGYGFSAEGDWKTAALLRIMKVMAFGLEGGNSFMEDYTYHFEPNNNLVLGAHMLEICPSIAADTPSCEVHPLGIGGKAAPVRLVFDVAAGPAVNASMVDMGDTFKLLINPVDAVAPQEALPNLPVARVLWKPHPDLKTAAKQWILHGGAHHTCFSQNLSKEQLVDFALMSGVESVVID